MFTFSFYEPKGTVIHRIHPSVKIVLVVSLWILAFVSQQLLANGMLVVLSLAFFVLSGPSRSKVKMVAAIATPLSTIVLLFWPLLYGAGPVLFTFPVFSYTLSVYLLGISWAILQIMRYLTLLLSTFGLVNSTSESEIACGARELGLPFLPAFIFTSSIRQIALLAGDLGVIYDAQRARALRTKGFYKSLRILLTLIIPLFMVSAKRMQTMTSALEVRAFSRKGRRSTYRTRRPSPGDFATILIILAIVVSTIFARAFLGMLSQFPGRL